MRSFLLRHAKRAARTALVVAASAVVFYALVIAPARAEVREQLLRAGSQLLRYEHAKIQDAPRTFALNGSFMQLSAGVTERSLGEVLDYFESHCNASSAEVVHQGLGALVPATPAPTPRHGRKPADETLTWESTMRAQGETQGFVACVAADGGISPDALVARAKRYVDSGDISALGGMRYVYATRHKGRVNYIVFWSDDALSLRKMFPKTGDAEGFDVAGVPRPPGARRMLSAREMGTSYQTNVYTDGSLSVVDTAAFYADKLPQLGWEVMPAPQPSTSLFATQKGVMVVVSFTEKHGRAVTTVMTTQAGHSSPLTP